MSIIYDSMWQDDGSSAANGHGGDSALDSNDQLTGEIVRNFQSNRDVVWK